MNNRWASSASVSSAIMLCAACTTQIEQSNVWLGLRQSTTFSTAYGASDTLDTMPLRDVSSDPTYGYSEVNPIKVGGAHEGPRNQQRFLSALRGPKGQPVFYERVGGCCPSARGGVNGAGLLDIYAVTYEGLRGPITLYLSAHDYEEPKVPVGFTSY